MFTFSELQTEVLRGATRENSGTTFTTAAKNAINRALYIISRIARWRSLRRGPSTITTITSYTEGSGAVAATADSTSITVTGATFLTDDIVIGRRINISGSSTKFRIATITSETELTLDQAYDGTTATDATYSILPQQEYTLPIQADHQSLLWHEENGSPKQLEYITQQGQLQSSLYDDITGTPYCYTAWNESDVLIQLRQASIVSIVSSSASDTVPTVTVYGTVSGYPDYETITVTGTTAADGSKSFSSVERIVASATARVGRITVSGNSGDDVLGVLPVGNTTREVKYSKVKLYPLPDSAFQFYVQYYKTPYMLVNDADIHELGDAFDSAIINLAVSLLRGEQSQDEAKTYYALYLEDVKDLKKYYLDKIDWLPKLKPGMFSRGGRNSSISYSQIGNGKFGPNYY